MPGLPETLPAERKIEAPDTWSWPRRTRLSHLLIARWIYQAYLSVTLSISVLVLPALLFGLFTTFFLTLLSTPIDIADRLGLIPDKVASLSAACWTVLGFLPFRFGLSTSEAAGELLSLVWLTAFILASVYACWRLCRAATDDRLLAVAIVCILFFLMWAVSYSKLYTSKTLSFKSNGREEFGWWTLMLCCALLHLLCAVAMRVSRYARSDARIPRFGLRTLATKYRLEFHAIRSRRAELLALLRQQIVRATVVDALLVLPIAAWLLLTGVMPTPGFRTAFYAVIAILVIAACLVEIWRKPGLRGWNTLMALLVLSEVEQMKELVSTEHPVISAAPLLIVAMGAKGWLFAPLRRAIEVVRPSLLDSASATLARSGLPPILLLRSFRDDVVSVQGADRAVRCGFGGSVAKQPLEEVVSTAFFATGPLIAISNPSDRLEPPLGAVRDSVDGDWQGYVVAKMAAARLIVCIIGSTQGLGWEVDQLLKLRLTHKTVFVAPPGYPWDRTITAWNPALAAHLGIGSVEAEHALGSRARVFGYDRKQHRWNVYETHTSGERAYSLCLRVAASLAA